MLSFQKLGIEPKVNSSVELQQWLQLQASGSMEQKAGLKTENLTNPLFSEPKCFSIKQSPRISLFSGDPGTKGEASFDIWTYEVERLLQDESYPYDDLVQAIHRSLRGTAARTVMRLGPSASITKIIDKLKSIFKPSQAGEDLLAQFYSARQGPSEDVTAWGCRLEDLLYEVKSQGYLTDPSSDEMLRKVFWMGLRQDLKDISGYKFDTIKDFDRLRVEIRRLEHARDTRMKESTTRTQSQRTTAPTPGKQAVTTPVTQTSENSDMTELKGMIFKLSAKVDNLESRLPTERQSAPRPPPRPFERPDVDQPPQRQREERRCFNCGQPGHLQIGCLIRTDHRRQSLNRGGPTSRGRW